MAEGLDDFKKKCLRLRAVRPRVASCDSSSASAWHYFPLAEFLLAWALSTVCGAGAFSIHARLPTPSAAKCDPP
jgi:hypothetical protein